MSETSGKPTVTGTLHGITCSECAQLRAALEKVTYGELLRLTEGHGTSEVYALVRAALEGRG